MNQACTGTFQVSVSRVVPASVAEVVSALRGPARRGWLASVDPGLRHALEDGLGAPAKGVVLKDGGRARLRYRWDGTNVEIRMEPRARGTSIVADNTKLADAGHVERRRTQWRAALDALKSRFTS